MKPLYSWRCPPEGLPCRGGVTGSRERAMELAAGALLAIPGAMLARVETVRLSLDTWPLSCPHERTGQSWTAMRDCSGTVLWAEHAAGDVR